MFFEPLLRASMGERSPRQTGRALSEALSSWGPGWQSRPMNSHAPSYHGYRFPAEIIGTW